MRVCAPHAGDALFATVCTAAGLCDSVQSVVSKSSILTARHCVIGQNETSFYDLLDFSPRRHVDAAGATVNPAGTYNWTYVSTFLWQPDPEESEAVELARFVELDIAVITYGPDAEGLLPGEKLGHLTMSSQCKKRPAVTTAGYPGDLAESLNIPGSQWQSGLCKSYKENCNEGLMITDCDIYGGQSGSPVYAAASAKSDTAATASVYRVVSFGTFASADAFQYPEAYNAFNMITPHELLYLEQWAGLTAER
jgi:V8-like Glu-specific endopeptidase